MQFGFTAQPIVLVGCGPPPKTSTLFCANSDVEPSNRIPRQKNSIISFFMILLVLALGLFGEETQLAATRSGVE
jgi:hypothetical protein